MPKAFPPEFRRDVAAVARKGEASIAEVARGFGISESCLARWAKIADRDDGLAKPPAGSAAAEDAEVRTFKWPPAETSPGRQRTLTWPGTVMEAGNWQTLTGERAG